MNILLINHYAGSQEMGMEFRPYYLAKEWLKNGHQVTIISASYSHLRTKNKKIISPYKIEIIDGIKYVWIKTTEYNGNGFARLKNTFDFSVNLYKFAKKYDQLFKPDVIIASSPHPFIIFGAKKMSNYRNVKLIFEVRDLWPLSMVELHNISTSHPFIQFMQYTENYAYRKSDSIISLLPYAKGYIENHGANPGTIDYIPNAINIGEWENSKDEIPKEHKEKIMSLKNKGYFLVGYAGTHGVANALLPLVEAGIHLKDEKVAFIFVGEGDQKDFLRKKASENEKIIFLPKINKNSIPNFLSLIDCVYIGWKKTKLYEYGVSPNKLMDYMMAGKPIIHSIDAGNDLVSDYQCGLSVTAEDSKSIASAIIELKNKDPQELLKMGLRGKEAVIKNHEYSIIASKFLSVMERE